jgi:hypothetical protein
LFSFVCEAPTDGNDGDDDGGGNDGGHGNEWTLLLAGDMSSETLGVRACFVGH